MSDPVRVLVADDQALVREGLMTLLQATPGIEPVAAAADGEQAVLLAALPPAGRGADGPADAGSRRR